MRIRKEARLLAKRKSIKINEAVDLIQNSPNQSIEDFPKKRTGIKSENISKDIICPICNKLFHQNYPNQKYCSKNCAHKAHTHDINKEDLLKHIIDLNGNFTQIGKLYGITDNAIRKWCDKFGFPRHKKELQEYIKNLKEE